MEKTWKPTTAGILNIITGAINALGVLGCIIAFVAISGGTYFLGMLPGESFPFVAPLLTTILIIALVVALIEAVLPILGGVFALQRRKWGWALAGSIVSILAIFPLGIAATVFVVMGKDEFE